MLVFLWRCIWSALRIVLATAAIMVFVVGLVYWADHSTTGARVGITLLALLGLMYVAVGVMAFCEWFPDFYHDCRRDQRALFARIRRAWDAWRDE